MKIIKLNSSNIKRLKSVELEIDENKNLVLVTGKNAAGKTSVLDSIFYAMAGKKNIPGKPIRDGEERADIEVNVDGYIIKRSFTGKDSYLSVTKPDGDQFSNAQDFLNYILGNLSFDPLMFSRLAPAKQVEELTKIIGIDLSEYDENKAKITEERLLVGREGKALPQYTEELITAAKKFEGKKEVSATELAAKLNTAREEHREYNSVQQLIKDNKDKVADLEGKLKILKESNVDLATVKKPTSDLVAMEKEMADSEESNKAIRSAQEVLEGSKKVEEKTAEYKSLTEQILSIDAEKKKVLSEAKMPIDGLSWEEDKVLFNNIPYDQISGAEQLRVSMAIAMAANPKLRVILIKDGSLLDQDNLKVVEEMAKDKDFQVWVESVREDGDVGILIEDGSVKSIDGKKV
ncbi:MAG: AAA family ATPase [Candidatus Scalindua sp.]|nr:AAA family ATPase [Candidatus Scalindua sp.]